MNFEQLHNNIILDGKVVFTLKQLKNYVLVNVDYPKDIEFDPKGIHKEYDFRYDDLCIDTWLDTESNFQSACSELYETFK